MEAHPSTAVALRKAPEAHHEAAEARHEVMEAQRKTVEVQQKSARRNNSDKSSSFNNTWMSNKHSKRLVKRRPEQNNHSKRRPLPNDDSSNFNRLLPIVVRSWRWKGTAPSV